MTSIFRREGRKGFTLKYRDATRRTRMKSFRTRAAAEDHALKLRVHPDPGRKITVAEYAKTWLAHMEGRLRKGSFLGYAGAIKNHLLPAFGHLQLADVTRPRIKDLMAEKQAAGISRRTVSNIHAVLHNLLAEAIEDGFLGANPAASHRGRGLGLTREERTHDIKAMDAAQVRAFLTAAAKVTPDRLLLFRTLAMTGMRLGEALALRWEDVDQVARTVRVERGWTRGKVGATKTQAGRRDVALGPGLLSELASWDAAMKAKALRAGEPRAPWIFATRGGGPQHHGRVDADFKIALAAAGLPQHFTPHGMRHTFASLHLQAGESIYWVSRQLGHASIKITVDLYGRWLPPGNFEAAGRLEDALLGDSHLPNGRRVTIVSLERGDGGNV